MNPEDLASDYLVSYLQSDSTLMDMLEGDIAPEVIWGELPSPFVRVDFLDGSDVMVVGLYRVYGSLHYHIRGVHHWRAGSGTPDRSVVNAIGARLDALLHRHEATTSTLHFESFREDAEPTPADTSSGDLWLQSGGIYRVLAQAL